jgi:hypothetical protein
MWKLPDFASSKPQAPTSVAPAWSQQRAPQASSAVDEPIEKIRNYVLTRMQVYKKVNNFYKALTNDMLLHLNFIEETRIRYEKLEVELVASIIEKGIEMNKFSIEEPKLAATAIVMALRGLEKPLFNMNDVSSFELRLDQMLKFLFMGIIKR